MFGAAPSRAIMTEVAEGPVIVTVLATSRAEGPKVLSPAVERLIVCGPAPAILKVIVPPGQTSTSAWRSVLGPLSAVLVTTGDGSQLRTFWETGFEVDGLLFASPLYSAVIVCG